jgi:hypothetical protein
MLTTKPSKIKVTKDQVQGVKETEITVEIAQNEPLDEVPVRIDEVVVVIDDLVAHDAKFQALDIHQQAAYLEHIFIFGPADHDRHFPRQCYLDLLVAKRDGKVKELKGGAAAKAAEKIVVDEPAEGKSSKDKPV